jgi:C4-dicarboxylate-specific signal transduction histidine kinase
MTHDIKNLLQSLSVLTSAAAREDAQDSPELRALLRRQLPAITQRLGETLDKLQRPQAAPEHYVAARAWWENLARQYRGQGVALDAGALDETLRLPRSLFDNVADNLLRNALAKRARDEHVRVRVTLEQENGGVALRVHDSGAAVPQSLAAVLLRGPVSSGGGLGIGLYQAARLADSHGYRLALESNRDGDVCFALTGPAA